MPVPHIWVSRGALNCLPKKQLQKDRSVYYVLAVSEAFNKILTVASVLFHERGYELVGINEIIEKAAVAKATFYSIFKSKENLCAEWLRTEADTSLRTWRQLIKSSLSIEEKVTKRFMSLKSHMEATQFRGCPFSITASMLAPVSEVLKIITNYKSSDRECWLSLARDVTPALDESNFLADTWFILYSGAIAEAQNARNSWPIERAMVSATRQLDRKFILI